MTPDKAMELIEDISYKPNFTLLTAPQPNYDGAISLLVDYYVPNSNPEFAPNYDFEASASRTFCLQVSECNTEQDLYDLILECLIQIEIHECREFFGTNGNQYEKPYHPHTRQGISNWRMRRRMVPLQDVLAGDNMPVTVEIKRGSGE